MKRLRKTAMAAALAVSMLGTGVLPVFANETAAQSEKTNETNSITVTNAVRGLNYKAYQLFTGTFAEETDIPDKLGTVTSSAIGVNKMGDVEFGLAAGKDGENLIPWIREYLGLNVNEFDPQDGKGSTKAHKVAEKIGTTSALQTMEFANFIGKKIADMDVEGVDGEFELNCQINHEHSDPCYETGKPGEGIGNVKFDKLESGYYLILSKDTSDNSGVAGKAHTSAILVPVKGNISIHSKTSTPTVDKQVKAGNSDWDSAATAGLIKKDSGKKLSMKSLTYKLTGTISSNIEDFDTYTYKFVDTLPKGVSLQNDSGLPAGWKQKISVIQGDTEFVIINDFDESFTKKTELMPVISTTAPKKATETTLETNSIITWTWEKGEGKKDLLEVLKATGFKYDYGNAKNISVVIEYAPVYTDKDIENIYNAQSKIEVPQENSVYVQFSNNPHSDGKLGKTPDDITRVYSFNLNLNKVDNDSKPLDGAEFELTTEDKEAGKRIEMSSGSEFTWTGLDANVEYTLKEKQVPAGFKKMDDVKFKIVPTFDDADNKTLISVELVEIQDNSNALTVTKTSDQSWKVTLEGNIINVPGPNMPITGQAGIWTGVAAGGAVITISAYAVLKKKKEQE